MTTPAQGHVGDDLHAVVDLRERQAADPFRTIFSAHVTDVVEHRLTLVFQRRFQELVREHFGDVGGDARR